MSYYHKSGDGMSAYVVYHVTTKVSSVIASQNPHQVQLDRYWQDSKVSCCPDANSELSCG